MTSTLVSFRYAQRTSTAVGEVHRPVAYVELYSTALDRWLGYTMIIDSGADYCVFPVSMVSDLGIALSACELHVVSGVGGSERVYLFRKLPMRIGPWTLIVPAGFIRRENVPPLLGRFQCLDRFDLRFHAFVTTFGRIRGTDGP